MIAIGIIGIATAVLAIQFKSVKPEYGILISMAGCIFIFLYSLSRISEVVKMIESITQLTSVSRTYIKIILKITGITFVSEISSDISKDCGYAAVANQIQIFGKLTVLTVSLPVFGELVAAVGNLLS